VESDEAPIHYSNGGCDATPILNSSPSIDSAPTSLVPPTIEHLKQLNELKTKVRSAISLLQELAQKNLAWHLTSALSSLNIIAAVYGFWIPMGGHVGRRRLAILSKGHCSLALYAWYALEGILDANSIERDFGRPSSTLQAHPEAGKVPGVVVSTGSLGQGLSIANGIAISARLKGESLEVAVLLGDGELDEGQIWEAAATASTLKLDNVIAIVDRNLMQHSGFTESIKSKEPLRDRWASFGWNVMVIQNTIEEIVMGLKAVEAVRGRPTVLLVHPKAGY